MNLQDHIVAYLGTVSAVSAMLGDVSGHAGAIRLAGRILERVWQIIQRIPGAADKAKA